MYDVERKKLFESRLNELMIEFSDVIGPVVCDIHGKDHCDCPAENFSVKAGWSLPVDTVLVSLWVDSDSDSYLDVFFPDKQPETRTTGLLVKAQAIV